MLRANGERKTHMALQLFMVGLTVKDIGQVPKFYRRLGVDIPDRTRISRTSRSR